MRDYIILNGVNSNTITGLLISTLPPITKPKIRTQTEEIDGRDGDIVTKLGYSAYNKEFEIGLYGDFNIDDVIAYFNTEGTVVFSNESDKYYNYQIIDQIDYEKLIRFKTAKVKMHVQPFKYPLEETPVEITIQNVTGSGENIDLDNTAEAPLTLALKGNTSQDTTEGYNLYYMNYNDATNSNWNGVTIVSTKTGYKITGTATANGAFTLVGRYMTLPAGTYTIKTKKTNNLRVGLSKTDYTAVITITVGTAKASFTLSQETNVCLTLGITSGATYNEENEVMVYQGTTDKNFEPYTNGASPNPDYPQEIDTTTGGQNISLVGKNIFNTYNSSATVSSVNITAVRNNDGTITLNGTSNNTGYIEILYAFQNGTAQQNTIHIPLISSNTYKASLNKISGTTTSTDIRVVIQYNSTGDQATVVMGTPQTITNSNGLYRAYLRIPSGATFTNLVLGVQLEKGSTATAYEPYQNQSYEINLGKNLANLLPLNLIINSNGTTTISDNYYNVIVNTNSTNSLYISGDFSLLNSSTLRIGGYSQYPAVNVNGTRINMTSSGALNTTSYNYILFCFLANSGKTIEQIQNSFQIEKGSTATPYAPYKAPIEVCKIGDYQDRIYKDSGKWYIERKIGKIVLNGSENWSKSGTTAVDRFFIELESGVLSDYNNQVAVSNRFYYNTGTTVGTIQLGQYQNNTRLFLDYSTYGTTTLEDFKTWLASNNTIVYYVLTTPTTTEITDQELITQLEAINNARSYDPITHITQNTADKPFIINATAVQKGTDTGVVDNEGNIYSKPTIDIEGTGTAEIYLNNNQIFSVDLSTYNECIIDTTNLEAYNPATSQLMNRQVTGDYSNFKLNAGENQIKISGAVTKATITNYTRWV